MLHQEGRKLAFPPHSLKKAQQLWLGEHFNSFQKITEGLKIGVPSFEKIYQDKWFDYLQKDKGKETLYHDEYDLSKPLPLTSLSQRLSRFNAPLDRARPNLLYRIIRKIPS